ncbi:MAG: hypothetical protein IKC80_03255, partial [Kiritimatiellae bacterium]|nr:hypothetical protein [Kiritimatiellia bacterium]
GAANLKIAAPSGGRANRPYQNVRTVARTEDVTLTRHGLSINKKSNTAITVQQLHIRVTHYLPRRSTGPAHAAVRCELLV